MSDTTPPFLFAGEYRGKAGRDGSNVLPTEEFMADAVTAGGDFETALTTSYVQPTFPIGGGRTEAAPELVVNLFDQGVKTDAESFMFDSITIANAIMAEVSAQGGGKCQLPTITPPDLDTSSADFYKLRTLRIGSPFIVPWNVTLSGGGGMWYGTRVVCLNNGDALRFVRDPNQAPGNDYVSPCRVEYLHFRGKFGATSGYGLATRAADGTPLSLQHGVSLHHLSFEDFREGGVLITGGSGVQDVDQIFAFKNGGPGVTITGSTVQSVDLGQIFTDGNIGEGLLIKDTLAGYSIRIGYLKSEQIHNPNWLAAGGPVGGGSPDAAPAQPIALRLDNVAGVVKIDGGQHISSNDNTYKPGDFMELSGANRPKSLEVAGVEVRINVAQVTGTDPVLMRDAVGGVGKTIPRGTARFVYSNGVAGSDVDYSEASALKAPTVAQGDKSTKVATTAHVSAHYLAREDVTLKVGDYHHLANGPYGTVAFAADQVRVLPFIPAETFSIDRIGGSWTSGAPASAGSKFRPVIYNATADGYPGTVALDGGQIAADTGNGAPATVSFTFVAGTLYFIGGAVQNSTPTTPTMYYSQTPLTGVPLRLGTSFPTGAGGPGYLDTLTGTPGTFSTSPVATSLAPRIAVRIV